MYLVKTPLIIQELFPNFTWKIPTHDKVVYLTFDDGPIPEVTPWVLQQLSNFNAKATFFCVGDNVSKYPEIFQQVIDNGHSVGNHTFNHLNGWAVENIPYFHNVRHCAKLVHSNLFRPPYGRLTPTQSMFLQRHYNVVMWDVLSGDFDPKISREQCYENIVNNTKPGSIIVMHDSLKSKDKLEYVLPRILEYFTSKGYVFENITPEAIHQIMPLGKIA